MTTDDKPAPAPSVVADAHPGPWELIWREGYVRESRFLVDARGVRVVNAALVADDRTLRILQLAPTMLAFLRDDSQCVGSPPDPDADVCYFDDDSPCGACRNRFLIQQIDREVTHEQRQVSAR